MESPRLLIRAGAFTAGVDGKLLFFSESTQHTLFAQQPW
jgi:hypothetical protein